MSKTEQYGWPPNIPVTEKPEEILSRTVHELGHPIAAIQGYADLILSGGVDNREAAKQIRELTSNTEAVLKAVIDYLQKRGEQRKYR